MLSYEHKNTPPPKKKRKKNKKKNKKNKNKTPKHGNKTYVKEKLVYYFTTVIKPSKIVE